MNADATQVMSFSPFRTEHLGSDWRIRFGSWAVRDGKLCHLLPGVDDDSVESVISGAPGAGRLHASGSLELLLPGGGAESVAVRLTATLRRLEGFGVGIDESSVSWGPTQAMQATLNDAMNATPMLDYDSNAVLATDTPVRIEIMAGPDAVRFHLDGRELFCAERLRPKPYRRIEMSSHCGVEISDMEVRCEGVRPARRPKRRVKPLLTATVDFGDDILEAPYTAEMLDILVGRLADLGIQRVYWMHSIRANPRALGPDADPYMAKALRTCDDYNADRVPKSADHLQRTVVNCYPFLPKVCDAARKRDMQVYAVTKLFDLGLFESRGNPSPFINDQFQTDHPEALFQRSVHPDEDAPLKCPVHAVKLYKDNAEEHAVRPEHLSVWVSDDNKTYQRLADPPRVVPGRETRRFPIHWRGGLTDETEVQTITIEDLNITARYFAVVYEGPRGCTFRNRLYRLTEVLDSQGRVLPFARNLPYVPEAADEPWDGTRPFVFKGFTSGNCPTGCWKRFDWIEQFHALDGQDVGIAFDRAGYEPVLRGVPTPGHPASVAYWTEWIQDALDAGVDGVDLRQTTHTNCLDWSRYGFGPYVEEAFRQRYGHDLQPDGSCHREHMDLLGELYTDFVRQASRMVRAAGKKLQHHFWRVLNNAPDERGMLNINWQWQRLFEERLIDAATIKSMRPTDLFFDEIMEHADRCDVETIFCPYVNCIFSASATWQQQIKDILDDATRLGMHGVNLYEVASFMRAKETNDVVLAFPELTEILQGVS